MESRERKRQADITGVKLKRGRPKNGQAPPDLPTMPPRQAQPPPATTQSPVAATLAPCEGFTVAYFVDRQLPVVYDKNDVTGEDMSYTVHKPTKQVKQECVDTRRYSGPS